MIIIKNVAVYAPSYLGLKDILICHDKIEWIGHRLPDLPLPYPCQTIDGTGLLAAPGFIDQHVHVTGGGGEGSFHTRTPEVQLSELIKGGITTVIGLLGTDGITRSVENLYAKTIALNEEGITAYMLTGSYGHPGPSVTGSSARDITFIKEALGMKLALSDHRAPNVTLPELIRIASDARVAGMLSGKPGTVTLHMGDALQGLAPVFQILNETSLPVTVIRPTHINRNPALLEEGYQFLEMGGYIDYTCRMPGQPSPGDCIMEARKRGLPLSHITFSSDGHGSWSSYATDGTLLEIGVSGVDSMCCELKYMVQELSLSLEESLPYLTSNVADALKLSPQKGRIKTGADADILLFDKELGLHTVLAKGQVVMKEGILKVHGTYER